MPQERSSGGMDGWTVVHGGKTRRARREEGGEEGCWAPANSESNLFPSYFVSAASPVCHAEGEMLRRVSHN